MMKALSYLFVCALLTFMLSMSAFAKDKDSGNFSLTDKAEVGSTTLSPGQYKAEWNGPANSVNVEILHRGKVVATTHGKIEALQHPSPYSATTIKTLANNTQRLDAIQFNNRSQELVLHGA